MGARVPSHDEPPFSSGGGGWRSVTRPPTLPPVKRFSCGWLMLSTQPPVQAIAGLPCGRCGCRTSEERSAWHASASSSVMSRSRLAPKFAPRLD
eukprot:2058296-Prymnesium_polylepis.1